MIAPRVVATDLDGTLLNSGGAVSDYSREILSAVTEAGITVILVTARPPRWMHGLADLGIHGLALCGNGAFTYDLDRREIVAHRLLPTDALEVLLSDLRHGIPGIHLATEGLEGLAREHAYRGDLLAGDAWQVCDVEDLASRPVGKILVRHEAVQTEELTALVAEVVGSRAEVTHSGAIRLAEIAPPGVSKAVALSQWAAEQEPPVEAEEVWAFGDMPNDLDMLTWAGRSFAVANAHPEVLAAVTDHIPGNDDDGVARTLADLLLG